METSVKKGLTEWTKNEAQILYNFSISWYFVQNWFDGKKFFLDFRKRGGFEVKIAKTFL